MTIDIDGSAFLRCPFPALASARAAGGVVPAGRPGWYLVATAALVHEVLRDPTTYSSAVHKHSQPPAQVAEEVAAIRAKGWPYTPGLGTTDPPLHTRHRKLVNQTFTPRALAAMEPLVVAAAADLAAALPDGVETDFVSGFAQPLPVWAISEILGLPAERRSDVARWTRAATASIGASPPARRWVTLEEDLLDLQVALAAALEQQRRVPTDRLISRLAALADEDAEMTTGLLLTILRELLVAGNETTAKTLAELVLLLDGRTDVWRRVRADPGYADAVVEEALRIASPSLSAHRRVTRDTVLGGVPLPAGSIVLTSLASANRDERVYPDPDRFDPDRFRADGGAAPRHLAFGNGGHVCVGAGLARMELRLAVRVLAEHVESIRVLRPSAGAVPPYNQSYLLRGLLQLPVAVQRRGAGRGRAPGPPAGSGLLEPSGLPDRSWRREGRL